MVFVIVHTSRPISKGLDHPYFSYLCLLASILYACLLLCFMLVLASLDLGFATLDALSGFVVVWLHPTPMRHFLGVTTWEVSLDAGLLHAYPSFSAPCDDMLAMLVCTTCWFSMHLYTLAFISIHES